jgi:CBS domain containing-hemolysin-like protein
MNAPWAIAVTVALLLGNGFFVAAEFAVVSARRSVIELQASTGSHSARTTLRAMENVSLMMAGAQLGITLCSLGLGALGEPAVAHLLEGPFEALSIPSDVVHPVAFVIAMVIVVFLHVVIGEMVPKNVTLAGPDRAALLLAPVLLGVMKLLKPAVWALNAAANGGVRLLGVQPKDEVTSAFTRDEVAALVDESRREGLIDAQADRLLQGALAFGGRTAGSIMTALSDFRAVELGATLGEVEKASASSGYSRLLVVDASGEPTGYVHIKDVIIDPGPVGARIGDLGLIRTMPRIADSAPLAQAVQVMQRSGSHLVQVAGADGTTVGVTTLAAALAALVSRAVN